MGMLSTFDVLADATRRRLLEELSLGECSVGTLVDRLDVSQPAVSKQLRVLRESGLASVRRDGRRRLYRFNPDGLRSVDDWLEERRSFWRARVDAMEGVLAAMKEQR